MKELIDRLSLGITEYTLPKIMADTEEISVKMEAGKVTAGTVRVSSANEKSLKGIAFSTDSRLVIDNSRFAGQSCDIRYKITTEHANKGEEIKGFINIVSSGGELSIPFLVSVDSHSADTSAGNIKNLFHFANLVQMSYDEAVKLFQAKDFPKIFLEDNLRLAAVYNGLIGSRDVNMAMEEFLVAANKKKPVHISISKNQDTFKKLTENYGDTIVVSKNTWGYTDITVETDGDFICADRKRITGQDFAGSNFELSYYIRTDRLHKGKNLGRIRFITWRQTLDYNITVHGESHITEASSEEKTAISVVLQKYIDFRMKKIDINQWADESESAISRARGISDSMFMKLLHAHVLISKGRDSDGAWLLENVAEELLADREQNIELYAYYLYLRTLQKRDDSFTGEIIKKLKGYYEGECDSWKILWMLFYLDESYDYNISLKLLRIKEQYNRGMRSPLLYYEALSSFNSVPEMLRVLDDFEIQVLNFGIKHDSVEKKLAMQVSELTRTESKYREILFKILTALYKKYRENEMLWNICSYLIKCGRTDSKYFEWYSMGVEQGMKITSLCEYYMYAISDSFDGEIPRIVLMYFAYNHGALPDEKADLLFAYIIKNKENIPEIYEAYKPLLDKYASENIMNGRVNEHLAVIYREVLNKAMIGPELSEKLPDIINTYEIVCPEENMRNVLIIHKETGEAVSSMLKKSKAYVSICTEDAAIIFEDINGSRYESVKYQMRKLLDMESYLKMCYEISRDSRPLVLYFGDKYLKYREDPEKSISILKYMLTMDGLTDSFRTMVEKEVIEYYSSNYDGDSLDEYLTNVSADSLGTQARIKIIELCIIRGLYERAFMMMDRYGFYSVEPRRVIKCAAKIIEAVDFEENDSLLKMTMFAFSKGKYNEETLIYLGKYYNGATKELMAIWNASRDFNCESRELEERIIVQMLFAGTYVGKISEIYDSYVQKGALSKVKKAYIFSRTYDYFVKEHIIEDNVFKYIERDIMNGEEVGDMSALAYLKHMSDKTSVDEKQTEACRKLVYEMVRVGKVFGFFKNFQKYFKLPSAVSDKTIVEYRTEPDRRVFIHYTLETGGESQDAYSVAEMAQTCDGIFTYPFVLFYGENLLYYITEEKNEQVTVTESRNISVDNVEFTGDDTHYGLINDILVCRDMHEEKTFEDMMKSYLEKKELLRMVFEIKER